MPPKTKTNTGRKNYRRVLKQVTLSNENRRKDRRLSYHEVQKLASSVYQNHVKPQSKYVNNASLEKAIEKEAKASRPKGKINSGLKRYHQVAAAFKNLNDALPEGSKYTNQELKEFTKQLYAEKYKGVKSRIKIADIVGEVDAFLNALPPKEICDPNYIDPALYAEGIEWWRIADHIKKEMPDCIYVKVNAGDHGETVIFNTKNFNKYEKSIKEITENIRKHANDQSGPMYAGFLKLRPHKPHDENGENYYIEYILIINDRPVADTTETKSNVKRTKKFEKKRDEITEIISDKITKLKVQQTKEKAAKKTREKNIAIAEGLKKIASKKSTKKSTQVEKQIELQKQFQKTLRIYENQFNKGMLSRKNYNAAVKELNKLLK